MSFAQQQFDAMLNDHAIARVVAEYEQVVASWQRRALAAEDDVCGNLALRAVLEIFITRVFPEHPLNVNQNLRERIYAAGVKAGNRANSYAAASKAGSAFKLPPEVMAPVAARRKEMEHLRASLSALEARLRTTEESEHRASSLLQQMLISGADERHQLDEFRARVAQLEAELQSALRDCAHHMAQSAAFREHLAQLDPEHPLITNSALRRRIADLAYDRLVASGGHDWDQVREVGRAFAMPKTACAAESTGLAVRANTDRHGPSLDDLVPEP